MPFVGILSNRYIILISNIIIAGDMVGDAEHGQQRTNEHRQRSNNADGVVTTTTAAAATTHSYAAATAPTTNSYDGDMRGTRAASRILLVVMLLYIHMHICIYIYEVLSVSLVLLVYSDSIIYIITNIDTTNIYAFVYVQMHIC